MPFLAPIGAAIVGPAAAAAATTGSLAVIGGLGLGAVGFLGKSLLGGSKQSGSLSAPQPLPSSPTFAEAKGTSIEEQRDMLRKKKAGGGETNLTGGLLEPAAPVGKTLLGG